MLVSLLACHYTHAVELEARWLRRLIVLVLGTAVTLIILIAAGTFDPKLVGKLQWERPLPPQTIAAGSQKIIWLEPTLPANTYSLRLTTAYQNGETDVLYGLVLGDNENFLAVAVSPLGYAVVWEHLPATIYHLPFQPWPHVQPDENEIWLDVMDGRVTIRLNRELYWSGPVAAGQGQVGLWTESFGETAVVDFQSIQLFAD